MNSHPEIHLDKQTFLHWAEGREGHFELKEGQIAMMTGGSRNHARITSRLLTVIGKQIDPAVWSITAADLAVEIGEDVRSPDVVVEAAGADGTALSTATPTLVAEVLSPSSLALDFNVKASEYMSLPSLEAYLVAAQDEMRMWLWQRPALGDVRPFPKLPEERYGPQARLHIAALEAEAALADIYSGIAGLR